VLRAVYVELAGGAPGNMEHHDRMPLHVP
jgi:hypothetical protein